MGMPHRGRVVALLAAGLLCAACIGAARAQQPFVWSADGTEEKIRLAPAGRWGLFRPSDVIGIATTDNGPVRVLSLSGELLYEGPPVTLSLPTGHYFVETPGDRSQFAVLPDDYVGASFLGGEAANGEPNLKARLQAVGAVWLRTGAARWTFVQPTPESWDWSRMDAVLAAYPDRKIIVVAADFAPGWAAAEPQQFIQQYCRFVRELARRYAGRLAAIEVWNEPGQNKFPAVADDSSLAEFYLRLHAAARAAIRSADPKLPVLGPSWDRPMREEALVNAEAAKLFDGWSWHDYLRGRFAPDRDYPERHVRWITRQNVLWWFGSNGRKPMLVTELGLFGRSALGLPNDTSVLASELDWHRGMSRAIKLVVLYRAAGVQCLVPHVLCLANEPPNPNHELFGWEYGYRGPHPKTSAFLMTAHWLNRARLQGGGEVRDGLFLYAWRKPPGQFFVFAWCREDHSRPLRSPEGFRLTDVYGQPIATDTLGEEPVLFHPTRRISPRRLLDAVAAAID
jgi:hypothetical protein